MSDVTTDLATDQENMDDRVNVISYYDQFNKIQKMAKFCPRRFLNAPLDYNLIQPVHT